MRIEGLDFGTLGNKLIVLHNCAITEIISFFHVPNEPCFVMDLVSPEK